MVKLLDDWCSKWNFSETIKEKLRQNMKYANIMKHDWQNVPPDRRPALASGQTTDGWGSRVWYGEHKGRKVVLQFCTACELETMIAIDLGVVPVSSIPCLGYPLR